MCERVSESIDVAGRVRTSWPVAPKAPWPQSGQTPSGTASFTAEQFTDYCHDTVNCTDGRGTLARFFKARGYAKLTAVLP